MSILLLSLLLSNGTTLSNGGQSVTTGLTLDQLKDSETFKDVDASILMKDLAVLPENFNDNKPCFCMIQPTYSNSILDVSLVDTPKKDRSKRGNLQILSFGALLHHKGLVYEVSVRVNKVADFSEIADRLEASENTMFMCYVNPYPEKNELGEKTGVMRFGVSYVMEARQNALQNTIEAKEETTTNNDNIAKTVVSEEIPVATNEAKLPTS